MKKILILLCFITCMACSSGNDSLKIATAANMQFAMEELIEAFKASSGLQVDMILSSSGKLTAQIEAGAPFDLFFSADMKYPERLAEKGLCDTPNIYAYGQLVAWYKKDEYKFDLYAMANPKTAPYGKATKEYLSSVGKDLPDVVYGESISQVNQFIVSGTVDAGYTSLSSVLSKNFKANGSWELVPDSLHSPIAQAFVLINSSSKKTESSAFVDFLSSSQAKDILEAYGYRLN